MMKIPASILLLSLSMLAGCSSQSPNTISQLKTLSVPVVMPDAQTTTARSSSLTPIYQGNQQKIDDLTVYLKTNYLQDEERTDMFDVHSQTFRVYAALTKLEQLDQINRMYLHDHNLSGLQEVNAALLPITQEG